MKYLLQDKHDRLIDILHQTTEINHLIIEMFDEPSKKELAKWKEQLAARVEILDELISSKW